MAEEEKSLPSRAGPKNAKTAVKKTRGLDLSQLDEALPTLNASGVDNAIDALDLVGEKNSIKVIKGSGNFKTAYKVFEKRRLEELEAEGWKKQGTGHSRINAINMIFEEFKTSPENPKNQLRVAYNASQEEIAEAKAAHAAEIEARLSKT